MLYRFDGSGKTAAIGLSRGGVENLIDSKVQAALKSYDETRLPRQVWYSATGETPELTKNGLYMFHFTAYETDASAGTGVIAWSALHDQTISRDGATLSIDENSKPSYQRFWPGDFSYDDCLKGGVFSQPASGGREAIVDGLINMNGEWIAIKWTSGTSWNCFTLNSGFVRMHSKYKNSAGDSGFAAGHLYVYDGKTSSNSVYELTVWKLTDHVL